MSQQLRKIPLTQEFLQNKRIYDRIWIYLQLNSYIGKDQEHKQHRFIYNDFKSMLELYNRVNVKVYDYKKHKEKNFFSYNTFVNSFDILEHQLHYITKGYIIDKRNILVDVYYLKEDFTPYKLIPIETLQFLMNSNINNIIKVYACLSNWYSFKAGYRFSLEELSVAIGYTSKAKNTEIQEILYFLKNNGLIDFRHTKTTTPGGVATYYYILSDVNTTITPLESVVGGFRF